jgi:anti-anti-sigma regulatory factor
MEFKIDTKSSYILITPVSNHLDANLTASLRQKCRELTETEKSNFIVDLHNCLDANKSSFTGLTELHEDCYSNDQSLVFTNIQPDVLQALKAEELDTAINIAPTMIEAIDIVSMEILERDLFGEEE